MVDVVLFGGGGHARVLLRIVRAHGREALGYAAPEPSGSAFGLPWLGPDEAVTRRPDVAHLVGAFGIGKNDAGARRMELLRALMASGLRFPAWIAQSAEVHDAERIGDGTVVLSGAVVVTGASLGRACIVNTLASVDHDCVLGDDVHVAPGAVLCGGVRVGDHTLVGAGATVVPGVSIAAGTLIVAGATVTRSIDEPGRYGGTPARRLG